MVQAPDATTVLGNDADISTIEEMASGEYKRGVKEAMPRDFVMMYHPDGTSSIVQLPPLPVAGRPQGKAKQDRQQKLMHYILNKRKNGKQWWFPSPPEGWEPGPLPYRCPVQFCERTGGMPDLLNLWRHIQHKHPEETQLYQGVLGAIEKKLAEAVPIDLQELLDGGPAVSQNELDAAAAARGAAESEFPKAVPDETFEGNPYECRDCDWKPKADTKRPSVALMGHRRVKHPVAVPAGGD